jgi:putative DNA methylase
LRLRKKLIEVALPLEAINAASAREKAIRHGHPSTLHLWWARRPLAAARAVIFSQMVDDPSEYVDVLRDDPKLRRKAETILKARHKLWEEARDLAEKAQGTNLQVPEPGPEPILDDILADQERQRLFRIIEQLVLWENTTNGTVLQAARDEIWASWRRTALDNVDHPRAKELFDRHTLPAFHDPFAGGGALPLEAQRLGLEAYASDLNPVAVLINKAMIEIPPRFAGKPPVNPDDRGKAGHSGSWRGAQGLADDIRYYGKWMRENAERRIGHLYPKVIVTDEMARERPDLKPYVGRSLTVIAWLWARTVKSPNPAFANVDVPLASTFMLSTKSGKEAYVEPVLEQGGYRFTVKVGRPTDPVAAKNGTKLARANFACLMSGTAIAGDYIKAEGQSGRMGARLMAIVAEGGRGRVYLAPTPEMEKVALSAQPWWKPEGEIPRRMTGGNCTPYGLTTWGDLFTDRQLVGLTTFSDLVGEARDRIRHDALASGLPDDPTPLRDGGTGAAAYAEGVCVYLAFALDKVADRGSTLGRWDPTPTQSGVINTFSRQALPMTWDYAESNPLGDASGNFVSAVELVAKALLAGSSVGESGRASQEDAATQMVGVDKLVSTDPPYYDNIGYADLSDFFYVWLRRSMQPTYPDLFGTLAVPKAEELVATPYRHGTKEMAEAFFLDGMTRAMHRLVEQAHGAFPVTIYYAFKQSETSSEIGTTSTGWETFLAAVIRAGFAVTGTWPMRTELANRMIGSGANVLASSIILVCRHRDVSAPIVTRRDFARALDDGLPHALAELQRGNVAPVDLAQAAIGPGMALFTRYAKVVEAGGEALSVRDALAMINRALEEALTKQEGDFDSDSLWALTWFQQHRFDEGPFGDADLLSRAKNTSVDGMRAAGIVHVGPTRVRLLRPAELSPDWDPAQDTRRPAWQSVHQLVQAAHLGEDALASLIAKLGPEADVARELAYRLFVLCDRKKWTEEAAWYNGLVQSWQEAVRLASAPGPQPVQGQLFGEG